MSEWAVGERLPYGNAPSAHHLSQINILTFKTYFYFPFFFASKEFENFAPKLRWKIFLERITTRRE